MAWDPIVGREATDFLASVPEPSREPLRESALSILGKGVAPTGNANTDTGLVVGYVQSGKTMSFEMVVALARDNGFPIVIVVAGIANPLLDQSTGRLRRDLQLDQPGRARRWMQLENPTDDDATAQAIRDVLDDWRDTSTPDGFRRTILITVLKHHKRLENMAALFAGIALDDIPVLIIDDEADQASLNNETSQGTESTTYQRLLALRQTMPHHTYLQYTATPQAPLLVSIIDSLSPNFVQVLQPGTEYVGGQEFFGGNAQAVRVIPTNEVPTNSNPLSEPPDTLIQALLVFMVGVAAGLHLGGNSGNRSMLVHPSQRTGQHQEFYNWVRDMFEEWKRILALSESDPDRQELIEDLRTAHDDLAATVPDLPTFDVLLPIFRLAFRNTRLLEVNARVGQTPQVDWRSSYGWILVGGQAMDRGFTVEGLTVTYMPRGIGVGNADTVQQRARFFGYKRSYFGYCRVYLEQGTLDAFEAYVEHEEDIRSQLQAFEASGQPLNRWKRAFLLDTSLRPCRNSVLEFDYIRGHFSDDWVSPRVVWASPTVASDNRLVVNDFVSRQQFVEDQGNAARTGIQRHHVATGVPLADVLELLVALRITGTRDSQRNTGMLLQLTKALEAVEAGDPPETCSVYLMSPGAQRQRGVDGNGEIAQLFQGEAPVSPRDQRGTIYPGDRAIRDSDNVTIQIHRLDLTRDNGVIANDVPVVAVWVPARMEKDWIAQEPQVAD